MHASALFVGVVITFIGTVVAQLPNGIPTCAQNCIGSSFGGCQTLDVTCICKNRQYIAQLSCCISQQCSQQDQQAAVAFANNFCGNYGVQVPQSAACSDGTSPTAASSSSSAASSSSSSAATPAVTATSIGGVQNATVSGSGGATSTGSGSGSATSGSSSSAAAQSSGAAGRVEGGLAGAMGLVLGGLAML